MSLKLTIPKKTPWLIFKWTITESISTEEEINYVECNQNLTAVVLLREHSNNSWHFEGGGSQKIDFFHSFWGHFRQVWSSWCQKLFITPHRGGGSAPVSPNDTWGQGNLKQAKSQKKLRIIWWFFVNSLKCRTTWVGTCLETCIEIKNQSAQFIGGYLCNTLIQYYLNGTLDQPEMLNQYLFPWKFLFSFCFCRQ